MSAFHSEASEIIKRTVFRADQLWGAVDGMLPASTDRELLITFGCCVDLIADDISDKAERALVHATAMLSVPIIVAGIEGRKGYEREASDAYGAFVRARIEDERDQVADHYADMARENA